MGFDYKYGVVRTEYGTIPDDEPVVVFRGRDRNILQTLRGYLQACEQSGVSEGHLQLVRETITKIDRWQYDNSDKVVTPSSSGEAGQRYFSERVN